MVYLTAYGRGGEIVINSPVLRGTTGTAGEMDICLNPQGERCNCGNLGCWEPLALVPLLPKSSKMH